MSEWLWPATTTSTASLIWRTSSTIWPLAPAPSPCCDGAPE